MTVFVYNLIEELPEHDRVLLSYERQDCFFSSIDWFSCLAKHAMPPFMKQRIFAAVSGDNAKEKCYLFCFCDTVHGKLYSMTNFYTLSYSPIFTSSECDKAALLAELACHISRERPAWHSVDLKLLFSIKDDTRILWSCLDAAGFHLQKYFQHENYFVNTHGEDFLTYYNARPTRVRNTIKRKQKTLEKSNEISMRIIDNFDETVFKDYMRVYNRSWKDREAYPDFIKNLCLACARLGVLRMGVIYVEKKPVASQLWFLSGRKAIIYKLAYDEDYKDFSVGSILTKEMARHALDCDKVEELDYGVGSEPYKKDWMDDKRTLIGIRAFNKKTIRGRIMATSSLARQVLKRYLKPKDPQFSTEDEQVPL